MRVPRLSRRRAGAIGNRIRVRVRLSLALAALVLGAAAAAPAARLALERPAAATTTADVVFHSRALDSSLHFLLQLPDGYDQTDLRYPVVYFLHGLPAGPTSYRSVAWVENALDRAGRPALLVVPQGTRQVGGDPEYHDWGPGRNWATALGVELPAYVDAHYRTIANRSGRAIVGISAGGYGAASIGLGHPSRFSVVESWSGYFEPTDPTGTKVLDLGSRDADEAANVHALANRLRGQFRRYPTLLAFYVGRSDPTFVGENEQLHRELNAAHVPHDFDVYPGGHTFALWRAHARAWLALALRRLAPAAP